MTQVSSPAARESGPAAVAEEAPRLTPMMAQYLEIKAAHPGCLLFYRMGDFYELFFEDAEIASRALGIVLTKRGKHLGEDIRMCGVPIDRSDDYLQRLIAQGHRVAVCEQMEDPAEAKKRGGKSVVQRAVVRLVTPGTITEERLLDPGRANVFLALARVRLSDDSQMCGLASSRAKSSCPNRCTRICARNSPRRAPRSRRSVAIWPTAFRPSGGSPLFTASRRSMVSAAFRAPRSRPRRSPSLMSNARNWRRGRISLRRRARCVAISSRSMPPPAPTSN
jgi:hypothetical protein